MTNGLVVLLLLVYRGNHLRILFQHLRCAGVVALALIQHSDPGHLLLRQCGIKEVKIVFNMRRVFGTGNDNVAGWNVPAEDNLGVALAILLSQLSEHRLLNQRLVTVTERIPCLDHDALAVQELLQLFLLRAGVDLRLENSGFTSQMDRISLICSTLKLESPMARPTARLLT